MKQIENKMQNGRSNPTVSIIILNINGLSTPIKIEIIRLDFKNNIQQNTNKNQDPNVCYV